MMVVADNPPREEEGNHGPTRDKHETGAHHLGDPRRRVANDPNDLDGRYPPKPKGHRRVDLRRVLNGILFRLRTGCQWNQLPKQFGDDSTVTVQGGVRKNGNKISDFFQEMVEI